MMQLMLKPLPPSLEGYYGTNKTTMPSRFLFGHPALFDAIQRVIASGLQLAYSDIFRSADASLARRREFEKMGGPQLAKRPGESPHNYGFSVDVVVDRALKKNGLTKVQLDDKLAACGLWCHRKDHVLGNEDWHYNALGPMPEAHQWLAASAQSSSTSRAVEARINAVYGAQWTLTPAEVTAGLAALKYGSVKAFQEDWDLDVDGVAGAKTQRLLAYLTAQIKIV